MTDLVILKSMAESIFHLFYLDVFPITNGRKRSHMPPACMRNEATLKVSQRSNISDADFGTDG